MTMRKLVLWVLLFAMMPLRAADESVPTFDIKKILAVYQGMALNGDGLEPVKTTFRLGREGELRGAYVLSGPQRTFSGQLSGAQFETKQRMTMQWTDKDGEGIVVFEFSGDYRSFTGEWSDYNGGSGPWSGKQQEAQ